MDFRDSTSRDRRIALRLVLGAGYLILAAGVLLADAHRATAYEVSIFGGTPVGFWLGTGVALTIALLLSFTVPRGWIRTAALVLGGMAVTAIAGLPIIRGYFFYGTADALTHLGWVRDIEMGVLAPTDLFYPGIHSVAVVVASFTGVGIERAVLITVATMAVVALVFVPLAVRTVAREDRAVVLAAFSTFLLFFVHNLGVYLHAHSFAQAMFFSALVLFLVFVYLTRGPKLAVGGLLAVASLAVVVYHPQQAANLILVFVAISLVQLVHRRFRSDHPVAGHRTLYAHTGLLTAAFLLWITRFDGWAFYNIGRVEDAFVAILAGRPPVPGGSAQTQAASLSAVGSGLPEIFVKLFLVAAVFSALAAVLMAASVLGRADESRPDANAVAMYLGIASLLALPVIAAYFVGNIAEHYFRHLGFLLLIAAIVGALALSRGVTKVARRFDPRWTTVAVILAFAVLLPLSLASVYPSPFIYKQTQHVTEPQMDGYSAIFDVNDESLTLAGIRRGPWRYSDAIQGVNGSTRYEADVSNANLSRLGDYYADGGYVVVTEYDRQREVTAYRELRYTDRTIQSVARQPGVNRVLSNDDVQLYHVGEDGE